jgi:hypothetical protein
LHYRGAAAIIPPLMLANKLQTLDRVLREHHEALYATLQPGIAEQRKYGPLREWFAWKNGQNDGEAPYGGALLSGWHRFVPLEEGQAELRAARRALWRNPIYALFVFTNCRKLLRSWPLLVDASGAGYYYDTGKNTVYYRVEGDPEMIFPTFESFVDFLIELAGITATELAFLEAESQLLERYASAAY